jgi:hypothetical protein
VEPGVTEINDDHSAGVGSCNGIPSSIPAQWKRGMGGMGVWKYGGCRVVELSIDRVQLLEKRDSRCLT